MLAKTVVALDVSISCKSGGAWNLLVVRSKSGYSLSTQYQTAPCLFRLVIAAPDTVRPLW